MRRTRAQPYPASPCLASLRDVEAHGAVGLLDDVGLWWSPQLWLLRMGR